MVINMRGQTSIVSSKDNKFFNSPLGRNLAPHCDSPNEAQLLEKPRRKNPCLRSGASKLEHEHERGRASRNRYRLLSPHSPTTAVYNELRTWIKQLGTVQSNGQSSGFLLTSQDDLNGLHSASGVSEGLTKFKLHKHIPDTGVKHWPELTPRSNPSTRPLHHSRPSP